MNRVRLATGMALLFLVLAALPVFTAPARAGAVIESSTVENGFPKVLTFKLTARADTTITDATLNYALSGRNSGALGKPTSFTPGKSVSAEYVMQVNSGSSYVPVGNEITYWWTVTLADGSTTQGPDKTFLFLPPNVEWKSVKGDFMTVYYHGDKESTANSYLNAGIETFDKVGKKLLNTQLKQTPVRVVLFDNEKESDAARSGSGTGSYDASTITCGTKVASDIIHLIPVSCGSPDRTDTLRHEFGHIINEAAGEGSIGKLPAWLDEGTAVYAQTGPGSYETAFKRAASQNALIPFSQMGVPTSDASQVNIWYGQAYAMASYLIGKGGPQKYADFFATIKKGTRFDQAMQSTYGLTMDTFQTEFAAANSTTFPAPSPVATRPAAQQASPTQGNTPPTSSSDSGNSTVNATTIFAAALLFILLAAFSFLMLQLLANSRRKNPPPPSTS